MRRFLSIFILTCFLSQGASAETIYLKNGEKVEGDIVERTIGYIKVDFEGIPLTYWAEEIDYIQLDSAESSALASEEGEFSQEAPFENKRNFLWRINSEKARVYILGSIHLAKEDLYPLDEEINRAFKKSKILVVEVNLNDLDPLVVQAKFLTKGIYPGEDTLKDHISNETFNRAKDKLGSLGRDIDKMIKYKPWFLAFGLVTFELLNLGFDPDKGIDQYFLNQAEGDKKILEFETIDYQLDIFDGLTDKQQELFLLSTLIETDILEQEVEEMFRAWKAGDVDSLQEILERGIKEHPELLPVYNKIFYERNKSMASKVEEFLNSGGSYFIVIGAGHLVGQEGVIQLLKNKGYSVEQL